MLRAVLAACVLFASTVDANEEGTFTTVANTHDRGCLADLIDGDITNACWQTASHTAGGTVSTTTLGLGQPASLTGLKIHSKHTASYPNLRVRFKIGGAPVQGAAITVDGTDSSSDSAFTSSPGSSEFHMNSMNAVDKVFVVTWPPVETDTLEVDFSTSGNTHWKVAEFIPLLAGGISHTDGDPHITFASGGKADIRGSHRATYVFVSSPGFQFAPYFQEVDFLYHNAMTRLRQLVHGTFMTMAMWRVRLPSLQELLITTNAMQPGEAHVLVLPGASLLTEKELLNMGGDTMKQWQTREFEGVRIETRMLSVSVTTPAWTVNVTSKTIYGLVQPNINQTHVHGRWEEGQRRLDIRIQGTFPQPLAHGIVGQSYGNSSARFGKMDEYAADDPSNLVNNIQELLPMTTSAQAEGAIDGVYTDYKLPNVLSTKFKYSRYDLVAPEPVMNPDKRTASTSEWDGSAPMKSHKKKLEL